MHEPTKIKGGLFWVGMGAGAAVLTLLIAAIFPSIIPSKATTVRL